MRIASLALLLVASGCSLFEAEAQLADDPTLDIYNVTLEASDETGVLTGRLGFAFVYSDVVVEGEESSGRGAGVYGAWELTDASGRFRDGRGLIRGRLAADGETVSIVLFDNAVQGEATNNGVLYEIEGAVVDGRIVGTWDRVGSYPQGTLDGRLVQESTQYHGIN